VAGNQLHEPLVLQPDERLAHRRPAHPEIGGKLLFEYVMPWRVMVVQDAPANFRVGLIDARLALPAACRGAPRVGRKRRGYWFILLPRRGRHAPVRYQN